MDSSRFGLENSGKGGQRGSGLRPQGLGSEVEDLVEFRV